LNAKGRLAQSQTATLAASTYAYDNRGRLSSVNQGSGLQTRTTQLTYFPSGSQQGLLQNISNALGQTSSFTYDLAGRMTQQTLADGRVLSYGYDANGNLISLTPPNRPEHRFQYDQVDQENQYSPPNINVGVANHCSDATPCTGYQYNLDKQLRLITRPDGQQLQLIYNPTSGKREQMILPRGTVGYGYLANTGQLDSITTPEGNRLSYAYDGILNTTQTWAGSVTGSVVNTFNNDFDLATQQVNSEAAIGYQRDNDGLLTSAGDLSLIRNSQHGLIDSTTLGSIKTTNAYNSFGERANSQARFNIQTLYQISLDEATKERDKLGRIRFKTETLQGQSSQSEYRYDLAGRLTTEIKNGLSTTFGFAGKKGFYVRLVLRRYFNKGRYGISL